MNEPTRDDAPDPPDGRPTWYLGPRRLPIRPDRRMPPGCTHVCREGDEHWTPIRKPERREP